MFETCTGVERSALTALPSTAIPAWYREACPAPTVPHFSGGTSIGALAILGALRCNSVLDIKPSGDPGSTAASVTGAGGGGGGSSGVGTGGGAGGGAGPSSCGPSSCERRTTRPAVDARPNRSSPNRRRSRRTTTARGSRSIPRTAGSSGQGRQGGDRVHAPRGRRNHAAGVERGDPRIGLSVQHVDRGRLPLLAHFLRRDAVTRIAGRRCRGDAGGDLAGHRHRKPAGHLRGDLYFSNTVSSPNPDDHFCNEVDSVCVDKLFAAPMGGSNVNATLVDLHPTSTTVQIDGPRPTACHSISLPARGPKAPSTASPPPPRRRWRSAPSRRSRAPAERWWPIPDPTAASIGSPKTPSSRRRKTVRRSASSPRRCSPGRSPPNFNHQLSLLGRFFQERFCALVINKMKILHTYIIITCWLWHCKYRQSICQIR